VQSQGYRALLAWLKDFLINFGTIFSGLIGTVISGVAPVLYPRFNQRLGYATTAIVSLMIGSFLSYRKQLARLDTLEGELAKAKAQRKCEIKLLESRHDRRASTDPKRELLSIDLDVELAAPLVTPVRGPQHDAGLHLHVELEVSPRARVAAIESAIADRI